MNKSLVGVYLSIFWIVSVAGGYMFGWYRGVRSVTTIATNAAQSSMPFILIVLAVVALVSGFLAFKARGYLSSNRNTTPPSRI